MKRIIHTISLSIQITEWKKRDKTGSRREYGTSHVLSAGEITYLLDEDPEILIVGRGQSGVP